MAGNPSHGSQPHSQSQPQPHPPPPAPQPQQAPSLHSASTGGQAATAGATVTPHHAHASAQLHSPSDPHAVRWGHASHNGNSSSTSAHRPDSPPTLSPLPRLSGTTATGTPSHSVGAGGTGGPRGGGVYVSPTRQRYDPHDAFGLWRTPSPPTARRQSIGIASSGSLQQQQARAATSPPRSPRLVSHGRFNSPHGYGYGYPNGTGNNAPPPPHSPRGHYPQQQQQQQQQQQHPQFSPRYVSPTRRGETGAVVEEVYYARELRSGVQQTIQARDADISADGHWLAAEAHKVSAEIAHLDSELRQLEGQRASSQGGSQFAAAALVATAQQRESERVAELEREAQLARHMNQIERELADQRARQVWLLREQKRRAEEESLRLREQMKGVQLERLQAAARRQEELAEIERREAELRKQEDELLRELRETATLQDGLATTVSEEHITAVHSSSHDVTTSSRSSHLRANTQQLSSRTLAVTEQLMERQVRSRSPPASSTPRNSLLWV